MPRHGRIRVDTITQVTLAVMGHGYGRRLDRRGHSRQPRVHVGCRRGQPQGRLMTVPDTPLITTIVTVACTKTAGTEITLHICHIRGGSQVAGISDDLPITDSTIVTTGNGRKIRAPIGIHMVPVISTLVQDGGGQPNISIYHQVTGTVMATVLLAVLLAVIITIIITVTGHRHVLRRIRVGTQLASLVALVIGAMGIVVSTENMSRRRSSVVGLLMASNIAHLIVTIITTSTTQWRRAKRIRDNFQCTSRPGNTRRITLGTTTTHVTERSSTPTEICRRIGEAVMTSRRAEEITTGRVLDLTLPASIALLHPLGMFS